MSTIITLSDDMPSIEGFEDVVLVHEYEQSKNIRFFHPVEDIDLFEIKDSIDLERLRLVLLSQNKIPITAKAFYEITKETHIKEALISRWDPFHKREKELSALCLGSLFKQKDQEMIFSLECEPSDMYRTFFPVDEKFHNGDVVPVYEKKSKRIIDQLVRA